jgi:hypothetical protein
MHPYMLPGTGHETKPNHLERLEQTMGLIKDQIRGPIEATAGVRL